MSTHPSSPSTLHRALLRPAILHILRATGFHSTRPHVLDTLVDLAERHLLLLASTTARHAVNSHNDPLPTVTDVRMAMAECGVFSEGRGLGAGEEEWREVLRDRVEGMGERMRDGGAGEARIKAEKRKREEADVRDVREFQRWVAGPQVVEMRRVAGTVPDPATVGSGAAAVVAPGGVGGAAVAPEDFLTVLMKKKGGKVGAGVVNEGRWVGTVLGAQTVEESEVLVEGGPVGRVRDWRPRAQEVSEEVRAGE
ncbi:hypothetical protein LTR62_004960 [Meristemomyces frigidus]|uniref:Bromodomain associated domain-containing protein n=1 Tax=Meristemomyces frigidus TaxID=1508187 RepID=A0AAN7THM2_9PEZI|nr:hypothetical protein LTR62_004960 [Meristemomyces frigidus]